MALTMLQTQVLAAIDRLGGDAYAVGIAKALQASRKKKFGPGQIYRVLNRLTSSGAVSSYWSQPEPRPGGRKRRIYKTTRKGRNWLEKSRDLIEGR